VGGALRRVDVAVDAPSFRSADAALRRHHPRDGESARRRSLARCDRLSRVRRFQNHTVALANAFSLLPVFLKTRRSARLWLRLYRSWRLRSNRALGASADCALRMPWWRTGGVP